jgi:hypothetical protein
MISLGKLADIVLSLPYNILPLDVYYSPFAVLQSS